MKTTKPSIKKRLQGMETYLLVFENGNVSVIFNVVLCGHVVVWFYQGEDTKEIKVAVEVYDKKKVRIFEKLNLKEKMMVVARGVLNDFMFYRKDWVLYYQDKTEGYIPSYLTKELDIEKLKTKPKNLPFNSKNPVILEKPD